MAKKSTIKTEKASTCFTRLYGRAAYEAWKSREAEIDIIGKEGRTLVFVEVKARRAGKKSGSGLEAVDSAKQKKICRCADFYMHEKGIDPFSEGIRFDVVAIEAEAAEEDFEEVSEEFPEICEADAASRADLTMKDCRFKVCWIRNAFPYVSYNRTKPHWRVW